MQNLQSLYGEYTFHIVALGSILLGMISGMIGCFAILKKESLLGDGISHAALPGIALAFLMTGQKHTMILLLGASATGLLAICIIRLITNYSCITFSNALALVISVFFGMGISLLTYCQKLPTANQAGLKRFIYGQASTLLKSDVILIGVASTIILLVIILLWKEFKVVIFDRTFSNCLGFPPTVLHNILSLLIVITIIIGLQSVGVILMSAMLIAPGIGARQWTNRLSLMIVLAAIFGGLSGLIGTTISSLFPNIPTGPSIVLALSSIAFISLLFAPGRGILFTLYQRHQTKKELV